MVTRYEADPRSHRLGSHGGPGGKFYWFLLSGSQDLYVGPTDINHQHVHNRVLALTTISHNVPDLIEQFRLVPNYLDR